MANEHERGLGIRVCRSYKRHVASNRSSQADLTSECAIRGNEFGLLAPAALQLAREDVCGARVSIVTRSCHYRDLPVDCNGRAKLVELRGIDSPHLNGVRAEKGGRAVLRLHWRRVSNECDG